MERRHTFASSPLDRASARRIDGTWLREAMIAPGTRWLPLRELRAPLAREGLPRLVWRRPHEVEEWLQSGSTAVFLGVQDGEARFAVDATPPGAERGTPFSGGGAPTGGGAPPEGQEWVEVRAAAALLPATEAGILAQARSLVDWHLRHPRCAACGGPTEPGEGGHMRACRDPGCGARHFPRTDPVVIVLVHRDDRCLLGRSARLRRAPGLYSCLAGYVEPGESLEEAVGREVEEETGVRVRDVRYHSSQPWPFPSTLMVGFLAEALGERISLDRTELLEARWFARGEAERALARWAESEGVRLPPPITIAHHLVRAWLDGEPARGDDAGA